MTINRQDALTTIKSLVTEHNFTIDDIRPLFTAAQSVEAESGGLLQRVMLYVGGVFVFVGLCVYIALIWDNLNPIAHIIVSLGSGLIAFILGMMSLDDARFHRAATPLFIIAAALIPAGFFVTLDEYFTPTGDIITPSCFVFGSVMAIFAVAFTLTNRTALLFFALLYFYVFQVVFMEWVDIDAPYPALITGLTGLMVSYGIDKTRHAVISPFFFFFAAIATAAASFDILEDTPLDVLLIGVSAGLIYLSTTTGSRTLLTVGVISLLAFLAYFTDEYFKDVVGWPVALIAFGLLMMGISVFAVKLGRKLAKTGA